MNRHEFDDSFKVMCRALAVKVNKFQAEVFWDEFKNKDPKDFAAACLFCSRGTPGRLPFQAVFGDSITAANEMRKQREAERRNEEANKTWSGGNVHDDPMERLYGEATLLNIKDRILGMDPKKGKFAEESIRFILEMPDFQSHNFRWTTKDPEYPRPQDLLKHQLTIPAKYERTLVPKVMVEGLTQS